ncbi:MAG: DUF4184 family protein [Actinomycetia bacterium]|nr:DUF4184 family protein [Actinomycetes bacterium]
MPFTVSHIGVVPMWGWLRPTSGPVMVAIASGSVTPDLLRGLPVLNRLPDLGLHDRGLVSTVIVGLPVSALVLTVISTLLIPGWCFVAPTRLAGLSGMLASARVTDAWKHRWALLTGLVAGMVSHVLLDTLTHEPPPWLPGSGLGTWAPFNVQAEPYPVYFILQFLLSAVGIAVLIVAAHRAGGGQDNPVDGPGGLRQSLQATLILAALYGGFTTRFYTSQASGRSLADTIADVGVGVTAAVIGGLALIGLGVWAAPGVRWRPARTLSS